MNTCIFCGATISSPLSFSFIFSFKKLSGPLACQTCLHAFDRIDRERACSGCSRPQENQFFCLDCQKWLQKEPSLHLSHIALFTYNEMGQEYMKALKFQGDLVLAELFTEELLQALKSYQKTHHIVPIPISKESMAARGFNQVSLLLDKAGIPYENWLNHVGTGPRQATKNRKERLASKQFLEVTIDLSEIKQTNKPILIIDDVYTTGRTILHAKEAFRSLEESIQVESFSLFR